MLEEKMREVAEDHDFAFRVSEDGLTYLIECVFESGRTQIVSGTTLSGKQGRMHVVFTLVGPYTRAVDLEELVRRQMVWRNAKVGLLGEDLAVCRSLDPERIREEEGRSLVEDALQEVSALGDELQAEHFSRDLS